MYRQSVLYCLDVFQDLMSQLLNLSFFLRMSTKVRSIQEGLQSARPSVQTYRSIQLDTSVHGRIYGSVDCSAQKLHIYVSVSLKYQISQPG
jgi:hypothetical protein